MSKLPLVSIIIPVFNTGSNCIKLLERLLESSYQNIEIICVDDGSTDDSFKQLQDFAKKHEKIVVKKQKNGGASSARNTGISLARGDFISFIDSDDYVKQDFIKKLVESFQDKTTMIASVALQYNRLAKGEIFNDFMKPVRERKKHENVIDYVLYLMRIDGRMYGAVTKLFRRDIIEKNELRFDEKADFAEDTKFVLDYIAAALPYYKKDSKIVFIYEPLYVYNYGTETSTVAKSALKWKNWQQSYAHLKAWSKKYGGHRARHRRHVIRLRWRISHALAVARANISRKEKLKYSNPVELFFATILLRFRK
ncbi:glycosyltransferase family 2 protein [Candidatus Saccharibacteria bacterium]|nr:glycosyltransferase family 2 protein [Candidatus Saccharibacteria bacterium]